MVRGRYRVGMTYSGARLDVHVTGRRIVATVLDGFVISAGYSLLTGNPVHLTTSTLVHRWWYLLFVGLYYVLLEGLTGRTVGKLVTGIRVVDERTGGTPGIGAALLRTVLRLIDSFGGYLLAWVVVLCSSRRRRLGDMAARTLVVRSRG